MSDNSPMIQLVNLLRKTSSTLEKMQLLKQFGDYPHVKEALRLCYEPFIHTYLANIPKPKKVGNLTFDEAFPEFHNMFMDLDDRIITGNAARERVQTFLNKVTSEAQSIFINILKKDLKAKIAEKTLLNTFGPDFINVFEVQLANVYDPDKTYKIDKKQTVPYFWSSRKLNGVRGYQEGNDFLRTRNGNRIFGFDHIIDEIQSMKRKYGLHMVDGELYRHGIPFQTIISYITADVNIIPEHKEQIRFNIFAIHKTAEWHNTLEMINWMKKIDWAEYKYIAPVEYERIENNPDIIFDKMTSYYNEGYEGAMLRHPVTCYRYGRSDYILKAKPMMEGDFVVTGFLQGKSDGEFADTLGSITVEGVFTEKDKTYKIKSKVGSGFKIKFSDGCTYDPVTHSVVTNNGVKSITDEPYASELEKIRDYVWHHQDKFIDVVAEVQFQSITDKPIDGYYSLQFPTILRFRFDKRL